MRSKLYKFFLWFKDHFLLLVEVMFRLRVGKGEERKTNNGTTCQANEDVESRKGGKSK